VFYTSVKDLLKVTLLFILAAVTPARAQMDGKVMGQLTQGLAIGMMGTAMGDAAGSGVDCACLMKIPPTPCPMGVAGHCAMLGLNIAAALASLIPQGSGASEAAALTNTPINTGTYDRNFDPSKNLGSVVCANANDPICNCSGANASSNILCGPDAIKKVQAEVIKQKENLQNGNLPIPENSTFDALVAGFEKAEAGLNDLLKGKMPSYSDIDSGNLGESVAGSHAGSNGKSLGSEILAGGSSDFQFDLNSLQAGKHKFGADDKAGLGKASIVNGLDIQDDETGKSLTIWQRLTRRMNGDERASRAYFLAKMEYLRRQSMEKQNIKSPSPTQPKIELSLNRK